MHAFSTIVSSNIKQSFLTLILAYQLFYLQPQRFPVQFFSGKKSDDLVMADSPAPESDNPIAIAFLMLTNR
jgi:hypothetical protein